jgi:integrase
MGKSDQGQCRQDAAEKERAIAQVSQQKVETERKEEMSRAFERKKGDGEWWIDFKDARGVRHRKKISPDRRVAKEVLNGLLGNVARRQHLGIIEESSVSFADFAKEWESRVSPTLKPRSRERWFGIVKKHLKPAFPGTLRSITTADAESFIKHRLGGGANPATINREVAVLKHMVARAVEWEYLGSNRLANVKMLKESPGRTRFLSPDEIGRLLNACNVGDAESVLAPVYLRPFVVVALNTGMRRNEILGLTRGVIDWQNRMVTLGTTKNGDSRHVYLNAAAFDALRGLPARLDTDRLFPFDPNQLSMAFRRVVKRAGIEDFSLHHTRHIFANYQAMAGTQGRGLQRCSNTKTDA